jgi:SAM-dependent methyltransferase
VENKKTVVESYSAFWKNAKQAKNLYPTEWVLRTLQGSYPQLSFDKSTYENGRILDIGFGDGRNWSILNDLGMRIYGVEISPDIVNLGNERALRLNVPVEIRVGRNNHIPFKDKFFNYILACHSCYYIDEGSTFRDNLSEYARVLQPDGWLFASVPENGASICDGATALGDGHYKITNDPWGLRNGYTFRSFENEDEIRKSMGDFFDSFSIGLCKDNYFGIKINLFRRFKLSGG